MSTQKIYPIGTPGKPWTADDKASWFAQRQAQRSYHDEVLAVLDRLSAPFEVRTYGALSIDPARYPMKAVVARSPDPNAPWALITGGVHGYETSGVQGALAFLRTRAADYSEKFNLLVAPCVSPWGYEVIHRWNPQALDPNRSFSGHGQTEEASALIALVAALGVDFLLHLDLHETTDSDETEFRPALAARDGKFHQPEGIPDGFYTVADADNPQPALQAAIVAAVARVTHIAPADADGKIIGEEVTQPGVVHYAYRPLGLCAGMTRARFTSTTEVYPDSPKATAAICNLAQVAAVCAALDHAFAHNAPTP